MLIEDLKEKAGDIGEHIEDIAQTYYKFTLLRLTQKATNITAGAFVILATLVFVFFVFLFCSLALAWWLGDVVENRAVGFLLVAAVDIIFLVILIAMRKKIIFPYLRNKVIKKLYDDQD